MWNCTWCTPSSAHQKQCAIPRYWLDYRLGFEMRVSIESQQGSVSKREFCWIIQTVFVPSNSASRVRKLFTPTASWCSSMWGMWFCLPNRWSVPLTLSTLLITLACWNNQDLLDSVPMSTNAWKCNNLSCTVGAHTLRPVCPTLVFCDNFRPCQFPKVCFPRKVKAIIFIFVGDVFDVQMTFVDCVNCKRVFWYCLCRWFYKRRQKNNSPFLWQQVVKWLINDCFKKYFGPTTGVWSNTVPATRRPTEFLYATFVLIQG